MIAGILLAAGQSERFGANKLLHDLDGQPLITHTLSASLFSKLPAVYVVVGHDHNLLRRVLTRAFPPHPRLTIVENKNYARGLMSSVKCGIRALPAEAEGALVMLGDMPYVTAADINMLLEVFHAERPVVATTEGRWTHPRLVPKSLFDRFLRLRDDEKGQDLLAAEKAIEVPIADARSGRDIDRPDDLGK